MQAKQQIPIWQLLLAPLALAVITAIIYYPSLHFAFQFDDLPNITKHFNIRHSTLADLFFSGSRWISYWINAMHYSIGKFDPFSYRVGNVIIHTMNGMLIFGLLYKLFAPTKNNFFSRHALSLATLTTALFLLHPAHTQTVSYVIQGQLEGLATMSMLVMALLYLWHARTRNEFSKIISTIALLGCAALACCTKEITIVAPALLLLLDWFLIAHGDKKKLLSRAWLLGLITGLMGALYVYFLKPSFFANIFTFSHVAQNNIGNVLTQDPSQGIKPFYFFISQFKVVVHYLAMYLWPFNMSVEYDWKLSQGIFAPDVIFPFLLLFAIGCCIAKLLKKNATSPVAFGALWFFICVAPRSSFIPSSELLTDYKAYAASIGWLFIIAAACIKLIELIAQYVPQKISALNASLPKGTAHAVALLLVCLPLGIATKHQNHIWSSGLEFWGAMIKNAPGKARAYNNYGVELAQNLGQWKESIPYYQKAIIMDAHYADPCNNLAVAYAQLDDIENAIIAMQQGLKINKSYPEGYNNLAAFYMQKEEYDQAISYLQIAIQLRPYYGKAHYNMGRAYLKQGKDEDAWQSFKNCCTKADMDNETGFACYAQLSFALKKYDDSIFACERLLDLNPRHEQALFSLANSYYLMNKYEDAARSYENMLNYYPNDQRALFNAGETYLRLKNPQLALACFERCESRPDRAPEVYQRLVSCKQLLGSVST